MHVISLQTGISRPSTVARSKATGIVKEPVDQAQVTSEGFGNDVIVDQDNHGGPDQIVYIYTDEDYQWWASELGQAMKPGYFGENMTFSLDPAVSAETVHIGDRYHIGELTLEVTAPRIPCNIFADRVQRPDFVRTFRSANRPGMYCRVIEPGTVTTGDEATVVPAPHGNLGLVEAFNLYYDRSASLSIVRKAIESPVSVRFRQDYERRLARATH